MAAQHDFAFTTLMAESGVEEDILTFCEKKQSTQTQKLPDEQRSAAALLFNLCKQWNWWGSFLVTIWPCNDFSDFTPCSFQTESTFTTTFQVHHTHACTLDIVNMRSRRPCIIFHYLFTNTYFIGDNGNYSFFFWIH